MIGAEKKLFEPSLFQQRAAHHPNLKPLPRFHFKNEDDKEGQSLNTHIQKEIVRDGIEHRIQVKHTVRGKPFGGARYYFTQGPVPGVLVSATARKGAFD